MGQKVNLFLNGPIDNEFICSLCRDVLQDPVMISSCEHVFCVVCITNRLTGSKTCPKDGRNIGFRPLEQLKTPPRPFLNLLNGLRRRCQFQAFGCHAVITVGTTKEHEEVCPVNPTRTRACASGCGAILKNSEVARHNCVEYLRTQLQQAQIATRAADTARAQEVKQMKAKMEAAEKAKAQEQKMANAQMKAEMEAMKQDLIKSVQESVATAASAAAQAVAAAAVSWLAASDGTVPSGALVGGSEGGVKLYVARVHHDGHVLPGKVVESKFFKHNCCYFAFGGKEQSSRSYEVSAFFLVLGVDQ